MTTTAQQNSIIGINDLIGKFFLDINPAETPAELNVTFVDGKTYIRMSYDKFTIYCKQQGFTYSNAVAWKMNIQITNTITGNVRNFKLYSERGICDIWECEEDENLFLIASRLIDAKPKS